MKQENIFSSVTKLSENVKQQKTLNYDEIKNSLIRFHVIANSDSEQDQNLKLKVKNEVIEYLYPYLSKSKSLSESRSIIKNNMNKVSTIAKKVIAQNHYNYNVQVELSKENFPEKSYGNITLPQGCYEAFRVLIGSGEGRNWWCVMFPPLCFVDESKAEVEYEKTESRLAGKDNQKSNIDKNVDKDSADKMDDSEHKEKSVQDKKNNQNDIQIKFKIVELLSSLFEK